MVSRVIRRTTDLDVAQKVDQLEGPLYQLENSGHTFEITCMSGGTAAEISGIVSGRFLCADGVTLYFTGTLSGNVASITLPQACYNVPGRFGLVVFVSGDDVATAIYAAVGNVYRSTSETVVNPTGVIPSPEDLIAEIEACEEATEAALAASVFVQNLFAPVYDSTKSYVAGNRVLNNNQLYVAINDVPAGTAFDGTSSAPVYFISTTVNDEISNSGIGRRYFFTQAFSRTMSANVFHGSIAHDGVRWILNGDTDPASGGRLFFDLSNNISYPYGKDAKPSSDDRTIKLIDGHTYCVKTRHISGTKSTVTSAVQARAVKYTSTESIASSYLDTLYAMPTTGDVCAVFTYDASANPDGIILVLYVSRTGGQTFTDFTLEVTLQDITKSGLELGYIAPVEFSPALASHEVGDLLMYNNCLVKVTNAISIGQTLSSSTNITATTIADEIRAIRQLINN